MTEPKGVSMWQFFRGRIRRYEYESEKPNFTKSDWKIPGTWFSDAKLLERDKRIAREAFEAARLRSSKHGDKFVEYFSADDYLAQKFGGEK